MKQWIRLANRWDYWGADAGRVIYTDVDIVYRAALLWNSSGEPHWIFEVAGPDYWWIELSPLEQLALAANES